MKKENNQPIELHNNLHVRKMNFIELSLQDKQETQNAIDYNKQNDYEYYFIARNLINSDNLVLFIQAGYKIDRCFNDFIKSDTLLIYHD